MISINKAALIFAGIILFSGLSAAVPQLSVTPDTFNETVPANQENVVQYTFTNENTSQAIYNITLENRTWLSWSDRRFDLNGSGSKTVEARIQTPVPKRVNDSFDVKYYYNESGEITFDKNYWPTIGFNFSTYFEETNVSVDVFKRNFTLELGEEGKNVFEVRNTGNASAFNLEIQGEDIGFQGDSNFNLTRDESRLVEFNVSIPKPVDNATAATNRTYIRTVTVSGENFETRNFSVRVDVPYKVYDEIQGAVQISTRN